MSIANLFSIRVPSRLFFLHSFPNLPADIICFVILRTCVGYMRLYFCKIFRITCLLLLCLHRSLGCIRFLGKIPVWPKEGRLWAIFPLKRSLKDDTKNSVNDKSQLSPFEYSWRLVASIETCERVTENLPFGQKSLIYICAEKRGLTSFVGTFLCK